MSANLEVPGQDHNRMNELGDCSKVLERLGMSALSDDSVPVAMSPSG